MRLVKFSVRNYRSITDTHVIELDRWTVLVGPNNEGKSNLLRALATALSNAKALRTRFIRGSAVGSAANLPSGPTIDYRWDEDYPIALQSSHPDGETVMRLWFSLSDDEKREFATSLGTRLRTDLSIELRLGRQTRSFRIRMPGPAAQSLSGKRDLIAAFISERLDFELIRAVRTAADASNIVNRALTAELATVEDDPRYQAALDAIDALQQPIFDRIGLEIETTLREFLPEVRSVEIKPSRERRAVGLRRAFEVIVDDGTATSLRLKGDGIQSIAALSLRRAATTTRAGKRDLVLLIEEPEAHLHPGAARKLRAILEDIAKSIQIVMTTHNPVFVDRSKPSNNVIVAGHRARAATSVDEIREQLGVHASDNLRHADIVLLVEGETDRRALTELLPMSSSVLRDSLASGKLTVEAAGGSDRLSYHASVIKSALCEVHAFLDFDASGRGAAASAQARSILGPDEISFSSCRGAREAEIEDMFNVAIYAPAIATAYGVTLPSTRFNRSSGKWSSRMQAAFLDQGRDWTAVQSAAKALIAELVATTPSLALNPAMRGPFDALVLSLEIRLGSRA